MSDEEDRGTGSLIPSVGGEIVSRSTALVKRGLNLLELRNHAEDATITQLRERAWAGDAVAQCSLGVAYALGRGVPQDYAQAAQWYRKAAEQGEAFAQFNLGLLYNSGRGVPQDYAQAAQWYEKAAVQGDAWSQSFDLYFSALPIK